MPSRKFFVQNSDGEDEDDEITVPHVVSGPDQYSTIDTHDQSSGFEASTLHPTYLHPYINQASPDAECTSRDLPTTSLVDHLPMTVSHGSSMSRMERTSGGNSPFIPSHPPQHAPLLASPLRFVATPGPGYATESSENKDQKPIASLSTQAIDHEIQQAHTALLADSSSTLITPYSNPSSVPYIPGTVNLAPVVPSIGPFTSSSGFGDLQTPSVIDAGGNMGEKADASSIQVERSHYSEDVSLKENFADKGQPEKPATTTTSGNKIKRANTTYGGQKEVANVNRRKSDSNNGGDIWEFDMSDGEDGDFNPNEKKKAKKTKKIAATKGKQAIDSEKLNTTRTTNAEDGEYNDRPTKKQQKKTSTSSKRSETMVVAEPIPLDMDEDGDYHPGKPIGKKGNNRGTGSVDEDSESRGTKKTRSNTHNAELFPPLPRGKGTSALKQLEVGYKIASFQEMEQKGGDRAERSLKSTRKPSTTLQKPEDSLYSSQFSSLRIDNSDPVTPVKAAVNSTISVTESPFTVDLTADKLILPDEKKQEYSVFSPSTSNEQIDQLSPALPSPPAQESTSALTPLQRLLGNGGTIVSIDSTIPDEEYYSLRRELELEQAAVAAVKVVPKPPPALPTSAIRRSKTSAEGWILSTEIKEDYEEGGFPVQEQAVPKRRRERLTYAANNKKIKKHVGFVEEGKDDETMASALHKGSKAVIPVETSLTEGNKKNRKRVIMGSDGSEDEEDSICATSIVVSAESHKSSAHDPLQSEKAISDGLIEANPAVSAGKFNMNPTTGNDSDTIVANSRASTLPPPRSKGRKASVALPQSPGPLELGGQDDESDAYEPFPTKPKAKKAKTTKPKKTPAKSKPKPLGELYSQEDEPTQPSDEDSDSPPPRPKVRKGKAQKASVKRFASGGEISRGNKRQKKKDGPQEQKVKKRVESKSREIIGSDEDEDDDLDESKPYQFAPLLTSKKGDATVRAPKRLSPPPAPETDDEEAEEQPKPVVKAAQLRTPQREQQKQKEKKEEVPLSTPPPLPKRPTHSPINKKAKVPLRVGLSKRARIEPLHSYLIKD